MSRGKKFATLLLSALVVVIAAAAIVSAQQAYLLLRVTTMITDTGTGLPGLVEVEELQVSPDGRHVYAGSPLVGPIRASIMGFDFDPETGFPTFNQLIEDDNFFVDGLDGIQDLVFTKNGQDLYVMAFGDDQVSHWARNAFTGDLTFLDTAEDGELGVTGLQGPVAGALSPDERHLYVAAQGSNALTTLMIDPGPGTPTFGSTVASASPNAPLLTTPTDVVVSPDGAHVYVSSFGDNAISIFLRDGVTGDVTLVETIQQNIGGITTLAGPADLAMDETGRHLYVSARNSAAVNFFRRDAATGLLDFVRAYEDDVDIVDGLLGVTTLTLGPKGLLLYCAGEDEDEIAVFGRLPETGELVFLQAADFSSMENVFQPSAIAVHPTGDRVLVSSREADAVHTFFTVTITSLSGTILDSASGDPVTCGTIELRNNDGDVFTAVTDVHGFYFVPFVPPDVYAVRIFATGYGEATFPDETVDVAATRVRNFNLNRSGSPPDISGFVTDAVTSAPLVAVSVQLFSGASFLAQTYTCASGAFELQVPSLKGENLSLRFELENYDTETRNINPVQGMTLNVEQPLMKSVGFPGTLTGVVSASTKGDSSPLPDATVTIRGPANASTQTDGSGVYSFDVLDGTYTIRASKDGFEGETLNRSIAGGVTQTASITLSPEPMGDPADVSGDGLVNSVDIQLVINRVLGIAVGVDTDINSDDTTNSIDIQLVINAVLGTK